MENKINKNNCKQCVADLGLDWNDRSDMYSFWKNTEKHWGEGVVPCPTAHTYPNGNPADGDLARVGKPPPSYCPHGFNHRMRNMEEMNEGN